ncbi:MAG: hypothetical protein IPO24_17520 [Bacteroidetes bacterium]|nr:hypothetical protein [Bacteroidota bacterium]
MQARDNNGFYYLKGYYLNETSNFEEDSFELVQLSDMFTEQFKKSNYTLVAEINLAIKMAIHHIPEHQKVMIIMYTPK